MSGKFWASATLQGRRLLMERRLDAVDQNDFDQLEELLSYQAVHRGKELTTALDVAILKKSDLYARCVGLLLQSGADPCGTNGRGTPFIHQAAESGCREIVKLLIDANCDVNQMKEDGSTALQKAAANGHVTCAALLLFAGAILDARDTHGRTALILASQGNFTETTLFLIEHGSNVNLQDKKGKSALFWVAKHANFDTLKALISANSNVDITDIDQITPLMICAELGCVTTGELLLNNGASLNLITRNHESAILLASKNKHVNFVQMLLKAGADVNIVDSQMASAMFYVLEETDLVDAFLKAGASPNIKTLNNVTALGYATMHELEDTVKLLLKANCDVTVKSGLDEEKYPLQIAIYSGNLKLVQMLFLTSAAMFVDLDWLAEYLQQPHFVQQVSSNKAVAEVATWLENETESGAYTFPTLLKLCRCFTRESMSSCHMTESINNLPLPPSVKTYLDLGEIDEL